MSCLHVVTSEGSKVYWSPFWIEILIYCKMQSSRDHNHSDHIIYGSDNKSIIEQSFLRCFAWKEPVIEVTFFSKNISRSRLTVLELPAKKSPTKRQTTPFETSFFWGQKCLLAKSNWCAYRSQRKTMLTILERTTFFKRCELKYGWIDVLDHSAIEG